MYLPDITSGTDVFTLKCACSTILLDKSSWKMFSGLCLLFYSCLVEVRKIILVDILTYCVFIAISEYCQVMTAEILHYYK